MEIDLQAIRRRSNAKARKLRYQVNPTLPLLRDACEPRSIDEVTDRALILGAIVAGAIGGFPSSILREWIERQSLGSRLTPKESQYLNGASPSKAQNVEFCDQVESLWALIWILGKAEHLNFGEVADDALGEMLPDIELGEGRLRFCESIRIRSFEKILEACDLSYCLHWAIVDASIRRAPSPGFVDPYVIVYRRQALEWVLSRDDWDSVDLDT